MPALLDTLVGARAPVPVAVWHAFWESLEAGTLERAEAAAVLASLSTRLPGEQSLHSLLRSLAERDPVAHWPQYPGAVNIVGTGGGPQTFNISTAAAFVAAAIGVRVVKTGSRSYRSRNGSVDLLNRLGVRLTSSAEETARTLDRFGIAFAGPFVYPPELSRLARLIHPLPMRVLGSFANALGPLLPRVRVDTQLTGVADHTMVPLLRGLARHRPGRLWLCVNEHGADELLAAGENTLHPPDGGLPRRLRTGAFGLSGPLAELRPEPDHDRIVPHFLGILAGRGGPGATRTVCLNAAALAVLGGTMRDWPPAMAAAYEAMADGSALALVERLAAGARRSPAGVNARG
ncbi:hypothetical protein [Streptomyces sp. ST2-7A]|uniref:hypothetical protein n=1 Tax=Streptomyces sp. ST2-7A TaxID=2907214 RepID=UPI001F2A08C1|nr:hypothetical protein [Streptomyces sp. ST2-7A]MCE7081104.1 hypothetical protein [Streptomyces sp. ST2-7A]